MTTYEEHGIYINGAASGEVAIICPECTPSRKAQNQKQKDLSVNVDKGTWNCHHCGWTGGLKKDHHERPEKHYHKPKHKPEINENVKKYFADRCITENTLVKCKIGYEKNNGKAGAITFPRFKDNECVAIKYRTHDKRMWQSKNPEPCFFNYDMAINSGKDTLIITEGEIDAMTYIEAGYENVVSVPDGAPPVASKNLTKKFEFLNYDIMEKFKTFILSVDSDNPGMYLESELSERIGKYRCMRVSYPDDCKDINDVVVKHDINKVSSVIKSASPYPVDNLYTAEDISLKIAELYEKGLKPGTSTGWSNINNLYTVRQGEMTIITGMPGSGKSTWLDCLVVNLFMENKWKVAFCSPENWPIERHLAGIVEKIVKKPFDKPTAISKRMSHREFLGALDLVNNNLFFTTPPEKKMTIDGILEIMQGAVSTHKVKGVVLDPWNELESYRPPNKSETEYISESLGKIRRFARTSNVHVWVVAHPKKMSRFENGTYPVPRMYDIAGSAHFFNKADNGISIHRPDMTDSIVDVYIQKIRFKEIGRVGNARLKYCYSSGNYTEVDNGDNAFFNDDGF